MRKQRRRKRRTTKTIKESLTRNILHKPGTFRTKTKFRSQRRTIEITRAREPIRITTGTIIHHEKPP